MRTIARAATAVLVVTICTPVHANKYGSVEPIANSAVIDTNPLRDQPLRVREAFATGCLECGIVSRVVDVLTSTGAIATINNLNTQFAVGAGGFAGFTNPSYVYTMIDRRPERREHRRHQGADRQPRLRDVPGERVPARRRRSLGLRLPGQLRRPQLQDAAADRCVGGAVQDRRPDRSQVVRDRHERLHAVRPRLSLAAVRCLDADFISGYVQAAQIAGVEYTPIVGGAPSLFTGGAAFPGNDWTVSTRGRGVPGAHSIAEPSGARTHSCLPSSRH